MQPGRGRTSNSAAPPSRSRIPAAKRNAGRGSRISDRTAAAVDDTGGLDPAFLADFASIPVGSIGESALGSAADAMENDLFADEEFADSIFDSMAHDAGDDIDLSAGVPNSSDAADASMDMLPYAPCLCCRSTADSSSQVLGCVECSPQFSM